MPITILITVVIAYALLMVYFFGRNEGRITQELQQTKQGIKNAKATKQRRVNRSTDNITTIRQRMQKYVRKS